MLIPKNKPIRDKAHLAKVRTMDCLIDKYHDETVVYHHLTFKECGGSMARKGGDNFTVPLRQEHHQYLHQHGETSFWELHGYTKEEIIEIANNLYGEG